MSNTSLNVGQSVNVRADATPHFADRNGREVLGRVNQLPFATLAGTCGRGGKLAIVNTRPANSSAWDQRIFKLADLVPATERPYRY